MSMTREDYAHAAAMAGRRAAIRRAMADAVTLRVRCHTCPEPEGREIVATIGGGVPAGAELRANHQPDGTHQPQVWYRGRQVR